MAKSKVRYPFILSIRISREMKEEIDRAAAREKRDPSTWARLQLHQLIEHHAKAAQAA